MESFQFGLSSSPVSQAKISSWLKTKIRFGLSYPSWEFQPRLKLYHEHNVLVVFGLCYFCLFVF